MTEPTRVGEVLPAVVAEAITRAGPGYERWAEQVAATGYCTHPVRLRGRIEHADIETGAVRTVYSTDREPDATLLKACGNRRASACPSCPATYQADDLHRAVVRPGPLPEAPKGGWCTPAIPTGKANDARMAAGSGAGSATTPTTPGWGSRCVAAATRPVPRCCGTPWPGGCGRGPRSMCTGRWPSSPG